MTSYTCTTEFTQRQCTSSLPRGNVQAVYPEAMYKQFTQRQCTSSLPRGNVQAVYPEVMYKQFTQRQCTSSLPRGNVQAVYPEVMYKQFTQRQCTSSLVVSFELKYATPLAVIDRNNHMTISECRSKPIHQDNAIIFWKLHSNLMFT